MPNLNLRLPILRRLTVKGYGLLPGKNLDGFDHVFEPGVTIIAGINGIGKTTILNLIYRLLVGPWDPRGDEDVQLTRTALTQNRYFNYFSKRDRGSGTTAEARGEFDFGERKLVITRRLSDLAFVSLTVDGTTVPSGSEIEMEAAIRGVSGCGSQYDFHLLVRSLLFFLEDKTSVVWTPAAQAEIFRILFLNASEATELARLANEIQQLDSRRRNMLAELNRYRMRFAKDAAASATASQQVKKLNEFTLRAQSLDERFRSLDAAADRFERSRDTTRQKLDSLKLDLEEASRELEHLHYHYFASLFPNLDQTAKNVFLNLLGEAGCLVCGSRISGLSQRIQTIAESGECPVCRSPKENHETLVTAAEFGSERINTQNEKVATLKVNVNDLAQTVKQENERYSQVVRERLQVSENLEQLQSEADQLRRTLPKSSADLAQAENYIKETDALVKSLAHTIAAKVIEYKERLNQLKNEVDFIAYNLTTYFEEYAGSFLAEKCSLISKPQKEKLGEAIELIEFPTFAVQMTSAVSPISGTTRISDTDVSESQKEFIDLAFRMSVLRAYAVAAGNPWSAMIVVETPEASLDSIFVGNAGKMLRAWCQTTPSGQNSIIASSNLNRENMISALLGLRKADVPHPPPEEVQKRVINLLEVAAPNAALAAYRAIYEAELNKALTPEEVDA